MEDNYMTTLEVDGESCRLDILEAQGREEYSALRDSYYQFGQGFLLVYSVTNRSSFDHILRIKEELSQTGKSSNPIVLVGNKCDRTENREVTTQEGKDLARVWGSPYIESSAKTNTNVTNAFVLLVKEIIPIVMRDTVTPKKSSGCGLL